MAVIYLCNFYVSVQRSGILLMVLQVVFFRAGKRCLPETAGRMIFIRHLVDSSKTL